MNNLEAVRAHLVQFSVGVAASSHFVGSLLQLFSTDPAFGHLIAITGDLNGVYEHPTLVLPGIRLAGALNFLALNGEEEELRRVIPPAQMAVNEATRAAVLDVLSRRRQDLWRLTRTAPQTNEVGRSAMLFAGLCNLGADRPVRLLELGSSGGLNLLCDTYAFPQIAHYNVGKSAVSIGFEWQGTAPDTSNWKPPPIISRKGCDLNPLDLKGDDFIRSLSYIWPDQLHRVALFRAAVEHFCRNSEPVSIVRESAELFLERELQNPGATVVMHSIMLQYPPVEVRRKIEGTIREAGKRATPEAPLHWLRFELEGLLSPGADSSNYLLDLITFVGDKEEGHRRILAEAHPHGLLMKWKL